MNLLVQFITDGVILAPGYPSSIQIPHAAAAAWNFRKTYTTQEWASVSIWQKIIGGYFCYGYGGTIVRDALLGRPISILVHKTILAHFLTYGVFLVHYSPYDLIFRALNTPLHPLRLVTIAGDAVDSTTTILSSFELALGLFPTVSLAPWVASISAMVGGSLFRWLESRGRGNGTASWTQQRRETEWCTPTGSIQSGLVYIAMYHYTRRWYGVRFARLWITLLNVCVRIGLDIGLLNRHPAVWVHDRVSQVLTSVRTRFRFGPQQ